MLAEIKYRKSQGVDVEGKAGVRLLTWGDPYLTAWLEAVRGAPLTETDYHTAGLVPDALLY